MSTRRLLAFLLGIWLGGSLLVFVVASEGSRSPDQLLASPPLAVAKIIDSIGHDVARMLLLHQASELNRHYLESWGLAQLIIGLAVFATLLFATREGKWLVTVSLVMLLLAALMRFLLTPDLVNYGRQLDFAAKAVKAAEQTRFAAVSRAYGVAELVKCGLGLILLGMLLRRGERKRRAFRKVHAVDDADDGHVDR
jgi:hypothetical protein